MSATILLKNYNELIANKSEWIEIAQIDSALNLSILVARHGECHQVLQDLCQAISAIFDVDVRLQYDGKDIIV